MQTKFKWLIFPPAIALLLFFGPLNTAGKGAEADGSQPPSTGPTSTARNPVANNTAKTADTSTKPATGASIPEMPSMWQVGSTLAGVILLGAAVLMIASRVRNARPAGTAQAIELQQSLRLSAKHQLHAIAFDDRLLLLGECDGNLQVLETVADFQASSDQAALDDRDDDDGAVPRDLVLPAKPSRRRPTRPRTEGRAATAGDALADFRSLLRKARTEVEA